MDIQEYERIIPHANVDGMIFYTPNTHCAWRVETMYTKEPDTIEWIRNMEPGKRFFDVGANVGIYTIFAAKRGLETFAFEPESQNYAILNRNIVLNKLNCVAFPICFWSEPKIDTLRLSSMTAGGSCHSFSQDVDYRGESREFQAKQGSIAFTLDEMGERLGFPDHVKIDVDGFEHKVLEGAPKTLAHAKSLLVEVNSRSDEHMSWVSRMGDLGFKHDDEQVTKARRSEGPFEGIGNIIFYRG